jgi:diguanylate cyclase (GGDEF)-like protein
MSENKKSGTGIIVFGVIAYIILMIAQNRVQQMNITFINGLIAQIQNILVVLMTVKVQKRGFIASAIVSAISCLQTLIGGVIIGGQMTALPGVVIPLVTILMSYFIYNYSSKMQIANDELSVTIDELNKTNETLVKKDEKLLYLAYHDVLTGLANKQLLIDTMDEKIANNSNAPFTILEASIDNLKEITDNYGLNAEDEIVFSYAEKIKNACGDKHFISYLNNGRFIILLDGMQSQTDIVGIANTISAIANEPIVIKDIAFKTTISYGVAIYPSNAQTTERLVQCANAAVDHVIANGGNNIYFYVDSNSVYLGR